MIFRWGGILQKVKYGMACAALTVPCGSKGWPATGCVMSSNRPEHPISSRDSGRSMGPAGGTSAQSTGRKSKWVQDKLAGCGTKCPELFCCQEEPGNVHFFYLEIEHK